MESFTIQCTSCESRIRVRNPNMIGQIANCPKCGSMILITAPQQITVDSGNAIDSVAVTREALPTPDESLLKNPGLFETGFRTDGLPVSYPQNVDLVHSEPPDDEYRIAADDSFSESMNANESSSDALPLGAWLPEAATTADPPSPPPRTGDPRANDIDASIQLVRAKRQESAARSRQVVLVATIALCSLLIAVGILFAFFRWVAKPTVVAKNNPPSVANQLNQPVNDDPAVVSAEPTDVAAPTDLSGLPAEGNVEANDSASQSTDSTPTTPLPSEVMPSQPVDPQANAAQATGPTTMGNASATKTPLGGSIAPSLDSVLAPAPNGQPVGEVPTELPPGLQGFSRLFNQGFEPVLPDASVPLDKAAELPDDAAAAPASQPGAGNAAAVDLVPATVDKRLVMQLSGVLINKRPLSEALTTLSLIGDVPIVADVDALQVIGVSKSTLVDVKATSAVSFEAVLKSISNSTNISFVPWENRVVYARVSDQELESKIPDVLPIADLVNDDAQRDQLLQAVKELLPELSDAVQTVEGGLQLQLTQENRLTWFQVARLLETWRVMRGISNETTSGLVSKTSLLPAWPVEAMQSVAKTPITQTVPAEPIARTWQRLTADARVACWIDWYGLQMAETNPRQKATVTTLGRTLGDLLQHYANKYQVVFAIDDARSVWVTSSEMHRLQPRLFVLSLADKSLEEWTAELESLAPIHPTTGASMLKLIPTPDGQYLFVRCCRPVLAEPN